ncbi:MAG: type II/IV secretion system protein [Pirellulales bacterium]|nr:type II/IV secretion system protein [Pirellulales bacterium]
MNSTCDLTDQIPLLVKLLLAKDIFPPQKLKEINDPKNPENCSLESLLIKKGLATDKQIAEAYADYLFMPLYEGTDEKPDLQLTTILPEKICRDYMLAPVAIREGELDVAFAKFDGISMADELQLLTGMPIRCMFAPISVVEGLLDAMFSSGSANFISQSDDYHADSEDSDTGEVDDSLLEIDKAPPPGPDGRVIRMVNQILEQAIRVGASDIHIEPFEDSCAIRLRVDGTLRELAPPPRSLFVPIVSRFKILAKMDIAEKRVPQDGAIALKGGGKRIDLRVNTVPTVYGEKMVMRLLDKGAIPLELTGLGFDERQSKDLIESIEMPHGLMLVTGPTGSGKSTTLYACLNKLNKPDTNICTVEDPVEYKFKGMNQVQVKAMVGLTFSSALRAFLRQDPDVIMVGEVRDQETAQICLRAALTGHFVLSTIHTNDSLSAVNRLVDMGIEPFLLASTLRVLEAQRLIRRLCPDCREPYDCNAETAKEYGLEPGQTLYRPKGCEMCRGSGYRGRIGVFEVVRITNRISTMIQNRASLTELRSATREEGMKLLLDSGLDKVRQGIASLEDVLTVAMSDDD